MSMRGGDPAEMSRMSTTFGQQAEQVRQTMAILDRESGKVGRAWEGPEARRFAEAWREYRMSFKRMSEELARAAQQIKNARGKIESATQ